MVELETVLTATTSIEEDTERTVLFAPVFVQPHAFHEVWHAES